jgi:Ras family
MADTMNTNHGTNTTTTSTTTTPRPLQLGAKGAYIVRLLMVGDSACGKTSLVLRFDQNVFSTKFVTTIGVDYRDKMIKVRTPQQTYLYVHIYIFKPKKWRAPTLVKFIVVLLFGARTLVFFSFD